ncbi:MAG: ATP-binding cassette domain-containing protein [Deltaproteobacteria bacterium]|nr:ATP-binding cassette domain-containing protein [Deltaproteobacteria bacterium]
MEKNRTPVIEVRDVRRTFRSPKKGDGWKGALGLLLRPEFQTTEALKGVSFTIEPGAFIGLIGANGAGKTTLLKILSGLIPPTSGEARVLGYEPFRRPMDFRRRIALVMGQKAQLWWDLPAIDAFDLLRAIYEIPPAVYRERLHTLAELLDVERHLRTQIRRLSLGERMKMELIGALIHWPGVVFLDEPTIGLDVLAAHKLREFLRVFNQREKATILLTSHNMDDIERLCSRVLILREGELIYDGTPRGLTRSGECRLKVRLMHVPAIEELARIAGVAQDAVEIRQKEDEDGAGAQFVYFTIQRRQIVPVLQALMSSGQIIEMGIEEQSLESVIQRLYGAEAAGAARPVAPG